ncbi:hypothetical protein Pst134EA_020971 [Puccinia striiformis f. sp. tritici]|uniref:hypothetical protein n=2 Tax=Puccinia striiformis f. sp. tritici TaxID=168172 RepID=UPI0020085873|nr:hypothetical protein Pst134EA_020971 [Puccinia striiformis f. sp. tritici]KAH9457072.1 hypothetical protein Pst134EA_020971 [Puccinia striiformis f. sp. tritici]
MAFQALINGSDCGPANPLQNLLKHSERNQSTSSYEQRNHQQHASSSNAHCQATPFFMNDLRNELDSINQAHPPQIDQAWQKQFAGTSMRPLLSSDEMARLEQSFHPTTQHQQPNQAGPSMQWSQQFTENEDQHVLQSSSRSIHVVSHNQQGFHNMLLHTTGMAGFPRQSMLHQGHSLFSQPPSHQHSMSSKDHQSKAQIVELTKENWEAEFAKIGNHIDAQPNHESPQQTAQDISSSELVDHQSPLSSLSQETTPDDKEADAEFLRSLEATWKGLAANLNTGSLSVPSVPNWDEFNDDDFLGPNLSRHPETPITAENVGDFLDHPEPYPFQSNNPFLGSNNPFEEGQRLLHSGAPLSEAALAFEAACQMDENRADAWRMLGETQAANEKEQLAIKAFQRAVGCQDGNGQSAWMSLAICWVNEGQEMRALAILERWLMDTYPAISAQFTANQKGDSSSNNPWNQHETVVEKFLQAARAGPEVRDGAGKEIVRSQTVDVDVQVGLGVLFYSNSEYERARDCFEAALGVNPEDFLLWN